MVHTKEILALLVFGSYFALIFYLFALIFKNLPKRNPKSTYVAGIYIIMTGASFAHTWYYMFRFMEWSFKEFEKGHIHARGQGLVERIAIWLVNTALFEQAWQAVCLKIHNWWWSEQLCLFTIGWTIFLFDQSRRKGISHTWAFMLLGQVVAISVAINLFHLHLFLLDMAPHQSTNKSHQVTGNNSPMGLLVYITLSCITVWTSPAVSGTPLFLPNLLVMHALLVYCVTPWTLVSHNQARTVPTKWIYWFVAMASLALRARTTRATIGSLPTSVVPAGTLRLLWYTLHEHPAQSSIGYDVVHVTLGFLVWRMLRVAGSVWQGRPVETLSIVSLAPLSVGVAAPFMMGLDSSRAGKITEASNKDR